MDDVRVYVGGFCRAWYARQVRPLLSQYDQASAGGFVRDFDGGTFDGVARGCME